jgi:acetylornithine deacetylase
VPQDRARAAGLAPAEALGAAAVDLAVDLVALDTVNPELEPGGGGERSAVTLLAARLAAAGFECEEICPPGQPDRPSLLATHGAGSGSRKPLLLNGHLDTVGVSGMADPLAARVVGDRRTGRLFGRGACDMKGGVAGIVVAAEAIAIARPEVPIALALVADEEHGSVGTDLVIARLREQDRLPLAALVAEPTWLDLTTAHRGFAVVEVELRGRLAHSSRPADGVNAVAHLGRLLRAVEDYDTELTSRAPHPVVGHGSLMATVARGGTAPFSLAANASAVIERRTVPGELAADTVAEVELLLDRLRGADATVDATVRLDLAREAWELDGSAASRSLTELLAAGLVEAGSPAPARVGAPYWMESALWQGAGVPTVVCGPAGGGLHAEEEWLDLAQLRAFTVAVATAGLAFAPGLDMIDG